MDTDQDLFGSMMWPVMVQRLSFHTAVTGDGEVIIVLIVRTPELIVTVVCNLVIFCGKTFTIVFG